jgi:hypothetical protein
MKGGTTAGGQVRKEARGSKKNVQVILEEQLEKRRIPIRDARLPPTDPKEKTTGPQDPEGIE